MTDRERFLRVDTRLKDCSRLHDVQTRTRLENRPNATVNLERFKLRTQNSELKTQNSELKPHLRFLRGAIGVFMRITPGRAIEY
jgi:hypothetical protein